MPLTPEQHAMRSDELRGLLTTKLFAFADQQNLRSKSRDNLSLDQILEMDLAERMAMNTAVAADQAYTKALDAFIEEAK